MDIQLLMIEMMKIFEIEKKGNGIVYMTKIVKFQMMIHERDEKNYFGGEGLLPFAVVELEELFAPCPCTAGRTQNTVVSPIKTI